MELTRKQYSELLKALENDIDKTNIIADIFESWAFPKPNTQLQQNFTIPPLPSQDQATIMLQQKRSSIGGIRDEDGTLMTWLLS